jgi:hypothetical protein
MSTKQNIIYFDGYCPESQLAGKQVRMRLNENDFWESEETGLQITTFPPYAAIIAWRGEANFKSYKDYAHNHHTALILTKACKEPSKDYLPDEKETFATEKTLRKWLRDIL